MKRLRIVCALLGLACLAACSAWCQDPAALALLASASNALTGSAGITSVGLTGTASYIAGSDEDSGQITLAASGYFDSKLSLHLGKGDRLEVQQEDAGSWMGIDGVRHPIAPHNMPASSAWFFPALVVNGWLTDRSFSISSLGVEERNGMAVQRIRCLRARQGQAAGLTSLLLAQASAMELLLDAATFLPVALEFNIHPDGNELRNIPVRIEFSDYRTVNTAKVPFRIRKHLQNTLLLDISITGVNLNPTISADEFAVQER